MGKWLHILSLGEIEIPSVLYHATYTPLINNIMRNGLDTRNTVKNWEDSIPGVIYLALYPEVAESYAESSELLINEEWFDRIVILEINTSFLDKDKLFKDSNVIDEYGYTYEYHGIIPPEGISIYEESKLS